MKSRQYATVLAHDPNVRKAVYGALGDDGVDAIEALLVGRRDDISKAALNAASRFARPVKPPAIRTAATRSLGATPGPKIAKIARPAPPPTVTAGVVGKSDEIDFEFTTDIVKADNEEQTVFGWASITEKDGQPVVDRQGDEIEIQELAKSAYNYVINTRTGGNQHKRGDDGNPMKVADMIESMVFTKEKVEKMGLPDQTPIGWWVGFKIHDPESWDDVKNGRVTGFSVHGRGRRIPHHD
jgi:Putative phage serine protease XkdF